MDKVKDMASTGDSNPRMIMKKAQADLSICAASQMVRHVNLRQVIHRKRSKLDNSTPATRSQLNAETREAIIIPSEYKDFVLADSGMVTYSELFALECQKTSSI